MSIEVFLKKTVFEDGHIKRIDAIPCKDVEESFKTVRELLEGSDSEYIELCIHKNRRDVTESDEDSVDEMMHDMLMKEFYKC